MRLPALVERMLSPGIGTCYRCRRPWIAGRQKRTGPREWTQLPGERFRGRVGVHEHVTPYDDSRGCFPLCEGCWSKLTPEQRLPYYRQLWEQWNRGGFWDEYADGTWHQSPHPAPWPAIEAAVRAEGSAS